VSEVQKPGVFGGVMEGTNLEKQILQSGVSPELSAALEMVRDAGWEGEPKYSSTVCHELTKTIAGRTYGPVMLELCHLLRVAQGCGGRDGYIGFFWGVDIARPSAFRSLINGHSEAVEFEIQTSTVELMYADGKFSISFARMPFLAAILEFLISFLGYEEVDEVAFSLLDGQLSVSHTSDVANQFSRVTYEALKPHLPTAQTQRKYHAITEFLSSNSEFGSALEELGDEFVLQFWIYASGDDGGGDFKTFESAFRTVVNFCLALEDAHVVEGVQYAKTIGYDRDAGQIDPGIIEDALEGAEENFQLLDGLDDPPQGRVKYLNKKERDRLLWVVEYGQAPMRFPRSVLRTEVFGAAQAKLIHSLRYELSQTEMQEQIQACVEEDYQRVLEEFRLLSFHITKVCHASFFVLVRARRPQAIQVALDLMPNIDLTGLSENLNMDSEQVGNVVSIQGGAVSDHFFSFLWDGAEASSDLANFLQEAERSFKSISRKGFGNSEIDLADIQDGHESGVQTMTLISRRLDDFRSQVDHMFSGEEELAEAFQSDKMVFLDQFSQMYEGNS